MFVFVSIQTRRRRTHILIRFQQMYFKTPFSRFLTWIFLEKMSQLEERNFGTQQHWQTLNFSKAKDDSIQILPNQWLNSMLSIFILFATMMCLSCYSFFHFLLNPCEKQRKNESLKFRRTIIDWKVIKKVSIKCS